LYKLRPEKFMVRTIRYLLLPALIGAIAGVAVLALLRSSETPTHGYADAVTAAAPSVVNIYSSKVVRTRPNPICELPRYRDLCKALEDANPRLQNSLGSGVIIRDNGYILTNAHVIADADEILVELADGQTVSAEIIGADPETDLAVIHAATNGLVPIKLGLSDSARVGDVVLAIGNPFGIGQTVSMGIISAKGRYGLGSSPYEDFLQTDAPINPGNSGGALIDVQGRLLGINSLIYSQTGGYQGISFAVPAKLALAVMDEIIKEGRVIRGWLGIEIANNPAVAVDAGLSISTVFPGSPAAQAGIQEGDLLLGINDEPAVDARIVTRQIGLAAPGSDIKLKLMRNAEPIEVHAILATRPPPS
jgi:serine protease DegS